MVGARHLKKLGLVVVDVNALFTHFGTLKYKWSAELRKLNFLQNNEGHRRRKLLKQKQNYQIS